MKTDESRHFPDGPIPKVAMNRVFNHLAKVFNAFCLSYKRVPEAGGNKSTIHLVFTYFKDDLLHIKAKWPHLIQ